MKAGIGTLVWIVLIAFAVAILPARAMTESKNSASTQSLAAEAMPGTGHDHPVMKHHADAGMMSKLLTHDISCEDGGLHKTDCCSATCSTIFFDELSDAASIGNTLRHQLFRGSVSTGLTPLQLERPPRT